MIPIGTLCIIVEEPQYCRPPELSGRVGTVAPLHVGQSLMAKCNLLLPNGRSATVWKWSALRPISPPADPTGVQRDKEVTA